MTQHVIVNRRAESNATRRKRKRNVPAKEGPTVLLVEDDPDMRDMLAVVLRAEGYGLDEIESITGIGKDVLRARLHRARLSLARYLEQGDAAAIPTRIGSKQ